MFATFKIVFEFRRNYITVSVNRVLVRFQFDKASDIILISRSTWEKTGKPELFKTNHIARSASNSEILLTCELNCTVFFQEKKNSFWYMLHVTDSDLNLTDLHIIDEFHLFSIPFNSVFNTFLLSLFLTL